MSESKSESRKAFEQWYSTHAFDYVSNPIGSRECGLQWAAWEAAQTTVHRYPAQLAAPEPSNSHQIAVKQREQFESFMHTLAYRDTDLQRNERGDYMVTSVDTAWQAWQAAQLAAPADLVRRLLDDHQRVEPHHADQCALCREATAAIAGQPAQGERQPQAIAELVVENGAGQINVAAFEIAPGTYPLYLGERQPEPPSIYKGQTAGTIKKWFTPMDILAKK